MTPRVVSAYESLYANLTKFLDYRVLGVIFLLFLVLYISFLAIFMSTLAYFSFVIEITACLYLCSL